MAAPAESGWSNGWPDMWVGGLLEDRNSLQIRKSNHFWPDSHAVGQKSQEKTEKNTHTENNAHINL